MDFPCSCNEPGRQVFEAMTSFAGRNCARLDEILQLHQRIHLLGPGIRECLTCSTNDEVMLGLLDGLATLRVLYQAASVRHSAGEAGDGIGCGTHQTAGCPASDCPARQRETPSEGEVPSDMHSTYYNTAALAMPSVVLGRVELTTAEANLVAIILIKQGLRQTGSHIRDLQHHLTKCLTAKKIKDKNYDIYKRRTGEILSGIYSSLACI